MAEAALSIAAGSDSVPERWVFGYGSLMWRPGFAFVERRQARLPGFHRRLCVFSHVHRGTPQHPGLVLGLDRGGSCRGMAFRVSEDLWPDTLAYLRSREQVTMVYLEDVRHVTLLGDDPRLVHALLYRVDRRHPQYAGMLSLEEEVRLVRQGVGQSGRCADYVRSTLDHLDEMAIRDRRLAALAHALAPPGEP